MNCMEKITKEAANVSPKFQNGLIAACGEILHQSMSKNASPCFSVLAGETADVSSMEQLCVCVHYTSAGNVHENFLGFVPVTDLSG
ncbi:hypothetical protein QYM36_015996 [Artemia franciscana]|uniref:Uncharacterized protein n=1 Tax=Artemia franciscana TaxID=6661 RepID=A0AA88KXQ6_ARTSF|nr:hypothetical protein QYM36_015996 [Artemia franciscana]